MGKVQGGMKCVKYLLFGFNFIFWLSGLLVLTVGLWLRFDAAKFPLGDGAPETFLIAVYILLGAGGLMIVVGFFGCFGAVRESQCLLASFFACLLIIFGAVITAGVFGFVNKDKIAEDVHRFYSDSIDSTNPNITLIVDIYEKALNCCASTVIEPCDERTVMDCGAAIEIFFEEKLHIIGFVGIGIAGIMVIGMIFSMVLCCAIKNSREVI
ncbi:PREDICTED: tetraspanin-2-like [Cyprinodon variegatus]|uniref:Tetraspanin n=1 Tax=Cyprinodon variegatus TaxID=28743 RepID=A0A3Q2FSD7_CYPVA|nr:PREDICTED: tetraspanin-2-like [Cyprinodon variegatus]